MRHSDRVRLVLIVVALGVACVYPVLSAFAQSQDYLNGTMMSQIGALGFRIDKIERMINAVLLAMIVNFIAQIVQIRRGPQQRRYR